MTSRERMLAAMKRQPVDRVPIPGLLWTSYDKSPRPDAEEVFFFHDLEDEIAWKRQHGFDPVSNALIFSGCRRLNPEIQTCSWREEIPDEALPVLCQEWKSPKGVLTAKLCMTEDYPYKDVQMFNDFNTSRYVKPLFQSGEDLLTFIRMNPWQAITSGKEFEDWRDSCLAARRIADREGVICQAYAGCALDYLIWSSRAEQAVLLAVDYPEETLAFLEYVNRIQDEQLAMTLEAVGADCVLRRGWYDSTDFWSPRQFLRFAAPFIQNTARLAHSAGLPCVYQMCTGLMPLLPELAKLEFDCLLGVEPVATGQNLRLITAMLGDKKSFWTGLSAPLHIGNASPTEVRQAVRDAFAIFGKQGFLLSAVPSIRRHWPWANVQAMVDEHSRIYGARV